MTKKALIVWGGWEGHTPWECAELFAPWLKEEGYEVNVSDSLESFGDKDLLESMDLVIPMWTDGVLTAEQEATLCDAIAAGTGIAGFHGGMCDAFRRNTNYQWMTGGQWVAHPGNLVPSYQVNITDSNHPITQGIGDFELKNTEQYYLHVDPSNQVLATTTFDNGVVMPYVWTRQWGKGRVFYAAFGHTHEDFACDEALKIVGRGMRWATR